MASGVESWSFNESDFMALTSSLSRYRAESGLSCVMLVDRSGQMITSVGEKPGFDTTSFASLTAADFSANDQLARLLGENEFNSLVHEGERESMYMAAVGGSLILVALFDRSTTLGMVRLRTREEVSSLSVILQRMGDGSGSGGRGGPAKRGILAGADDEIDQLFK